MKSTASQKWINAAMILGNDPSKRVLCPECGKLDLVVKDLDAGTQSAIFERMMYCPSCNARNFMRMTKPN